MEDKIQEIIDILGDQFSQLQIKDALALTSESIDDAIEYLLNDDQNSGKKELFTENIIEKDKASQDVNVGKQNDIQYQRQDIRQNYDYHSLILSNNQDFLESSSKHQKSNQLKIIENKIQNLNTYDFLGLIQHQDYNRSLQRQIEESMMIFEYSSPVEYEVSLRECREKKKKVEQNTKL